MIRKNNNIDTKVIRGGIYLVDLRERVGSEQGGLRPVVVIQNDTGYRQQIFANDNYLSFDIKE